MQPGCERPPVANQAWKLLIREVTVSGRTNMPITGSSTNSITATAQISIAATFELWLSLVAAMSEIASR